MREPTTRGPAVEIEELEKRLRSNPPPSQKPSIRLDIPVSTGPMRENRPDPLAELARRMPPTQPRTNHKPDAIALKPQQLSPRANPSASVMPTRPEPACAPPPRPVAAPPIPPLSAPRPPSLARPVAPPPAIPAPTIPVPGVPAPAMRAPALRAPAAPASRAISPPPIPAQSSAGRSTPQIPALPQIPTVPSPPTVSSLPTLPSLPTSSSLPKLPPLPEIQHSLPLLPPLPSLPKRDPQHGGELQPPTFTPPAPPPPAYDASDMFLRGTLPIEDNAAGVPFGSHGDAPGLAPPVNSWLATPEPRGSSQATEDLNSLSRSADSHYSNHQSTDPVRAPDIRATDPSHPPHRHAGYGGEEHYDDSTSGWPDESQYAFDEFDSDEETYAAGEVHDPRLAPPPAGLKVFRRKLRPWHAIAAVAALAVVSIGWSFLHRSGVDGSREIATIEAPEGPMKVKPTIEEESDAPTAGAAAVLDRNEPEPVKKVVKNLEQAVDPSVAPQQNADSTLDVAAPAETPGAVKLGAGRVDAPHEPPPASVVQQPRKVKSVAVPAIPVELQAPPAVAAPQPTAPAAAKPAAAGNYWAQFASVNSEAEARTLLKTLSGKYGGATGGAKFTYRPVKTGDKTVYRVRVGGLTREVAEAVCAKAKTGGDACATVGN